MAEEGRDLHLPNPVGDRAFDETAQALVVEALEQIGDEAAGAPPDARFLAMRRLEEAADRAGEVDVAHPPRDHRRDEEILPEEIGQRLADPVLVAGNDRGVRDRQAKRMAEQRGDREPVGQSADHRRLGEGLHIAEPGIGSFELTGGDEHRRHDQQQPGCRRLHPGRARLNRVEAREGRLGAARSLPPL